MNVQLWQGTDLKLVYASLHIQRMRESLHAPPRTNITVTLESSGTYIGIDWQRNLYAHFDAFLFCTRSIAEIINGCFGHDQSRWLNDWRKTLTQDEKIRRVAFTDRFKDARRCFDKHILTKYRNISAHGAGYAPVLVAFDGMYGSYQANQTIRLSSHVQQADLEMGAIGQRRPKPQDFTIDGRNIFEACDEYLQIAKELVTEAQRIEADIHGSKPLSDPMGLRP